MSVLPPHLAERTRRIGTRAALLKAILGIAVAGGGCKGCASSPSPERAAPPAPGINPGTSRFLCASPRSLSIGGTDTGFEVCADGSRHRARARNCPKAPPPVCEPWPPNAGGLAGCTRDADCSERANGVCGLLHPAGSCHCVYGCRADADCASDEICQCGEPVGHCVSARCRDDSSCVEGNICTSVALCDGPLSYRCRGGADACGGDGDCVEVADAGRTTSGSPRCSVPQGLVARGCLPRGCALMVGRPLTVGSVAIVAPLARRRDWA